MENKLIPLSDFMLKAQRWESPEDVFESATKALSRCMNYAKFLKQPLTLGMFVPVDENNVPLEEPNVKEYMDADNEPNNTYFWEVEEHRRAKDKIIFEGFEVGYNGLDIISAWRNEITLVFNKNTGICEEYKTIEEFANSNKQPKLTKSPIT